MSGPDLEQRRAKSALAAITAYQKEAPPKEWDGYRSYVKALPAAILMNGLGQALAMELAQGGIAPNAHKQIYLHLEEWLCGADADAIFPNTKASAPRLLNALYDADQAIYLRAQAEAQLYLGWLKKFANALLVPPPGGSAS